MKYVWTVFILFLARFSNKKDHEEYQSWPQVIEIQLELSFFGKFSWINTLLGKGGFFTSSINPPSMHTFLLSSIDSNMPKQENTIYQS